MHSMNCLCLVLHWWWFNKLELLVCVQYLWSPLYLWIRSREYIKVHFMSWGRLTRHLYNETWVGNTAVPQASNSFSGILCKDCFVFLPCMMIIQKLLNICKHCNIFYRYIFSTLPCGAPCPEHFKEIVSVSEWHI